MKRLHFTLAICALFVTACQHTNAQEQTFEALLQRLSDTEKRVQQLEQQNVAAPSFRLASDTAAPEIPPAADETPAVTDRLSELEEKWSKLNDSWSAFEMSEAKKKADAKKKPSFKINGRIHADFWDFIEDDGGIGFLENPIGSGPPVAREGTDPEDRFAFRRIRMEMKGDILDSMLWRMQLDFNKPGTGEMKDMYIGWKNLPNNQVLLIGNQKRPLGLDHLNSSRFNVFTERPFVVETFNEDARRPGMAMYGYSDDESFHWRYGAYYLENLTSDGGNFGDSRQMSANFRLCGSPWYDHSSNGRGYFHWAVAGMVAKPDGDDIDNDRHANEGRFRTRPEARSTTRWLDTGRIRGADWYETVALEGIFNVGPLQITGEFMQNWMQRDSIGATSFADTSFQGGYVYVNYMLTGEHIPYDRKTGTIGRLQPFENFFLVDRCGGGRASGLGAVGIAARYSYLDISDKDVFGGVGESATLALNWYWTAYSKLQFNLIYGSISGRNAAAIGTTGGDYLIAGTRFAIEF